MKKIRLLSLILALSLVLTMFAACGNTGSSEDEDDEEDEDEVKTTETTAETKEDIDPTETGPDNTVPEVTEPSEVPDETTPNEDPNAGEPAPGPSGNTTQPSNKSSLGTWNGKTYTNEYAGFKITFDNNWTYLSANELQEMPDTIQGLVDDTTLGQLMTQFTQVMDLNAADNLTGNSTNVVYQNIPAEQKSLLAGMSDEEVVELQLMSKELLEETYAAMGIEVTTMEKTTVNFLGKTVYALKTTASYSGLDVYMVQLAWYNLGDWSVSLTITTYINDATQEVLNMYKPA